MVHQLHLQFWSLDSGVSILDRKIMSFLARGFIPMALLDSNQSLILYRRLGTIPNGMLCKPLICCHKIKLFTQFTIRNQDPLMYLTDFKLYIWSHIWSNHAIDQIRHLIKSCILPQVLQPIGLSNFEIVQFIDYLILDTCINDSF